MKRYYHGKENQTLKPERKDSANHEIKNINTQYKDKVYDDNIAVDRDRFGVK